MAKSELLYVKGMNSSESDEEIGDIWDDKKLNDAYDKALRIANVEVAKRVAMSTNTQGNKDHSKNKKGRPTSKPSSSKIDIEWKTGMPCRAIYEGDGLEYEAFLLRMINDKECVVRFLGYENSEIVLINSLKPTLGNEERTRQIQQALNEKEDDGFGSQSPNCDGMDFGSDRIPSPGSTEKSFQKKKTSKSKKKQAGQWKGFDLPEMNMPNFSMLNNLGSMDMPMPPPPPMNFANHNRSDSEEQAISSMLLSWYMSGYYTGLYQGMKRAKKTQGNM